MQIFLFNTHGLWIAGAELPEPALSGAKELAYLSPWHESLSFVELPEPSFIPQGEAACPMTKVAVGSPLLS